MTDLLVVIGFVVIVLAGIGALYGALGDDQLDRMGGSCKAAAMRALMGDDEAEP